MAVFWLIGKILSFCAMMPNIDQHADRFSRRICSKPAAALSLSIVRAFTVPFLHPCGHGYWPHGISLRGPELLCAAKTMQHLHGVWQDLEMASRFLYASPGRKRSQQLLNHVEAHEMMCNLPLVQVQHHVQLNERDRTMGPAANPMSVSFSVPPLQATQTSSVSRIIEGCRQLVCLLPGWLLLSKSGMVG